MFSFNKVLRFFSVVIVLACLSIKTQAEEFESMKSWRDQKEETFSEAEASFKLVMERLLQKHLDKSIKKDDLYRAATAGMLASLNSGEEAWNKLLSPREIKEMQIEMSGKVTGIGAEMKFLENSGHALILRVIPGSPSEKSGLLKDDQILSVDGVKFKGRPFRDLVNSIRGQLGQTVNIKILRDDQILDLKIKRQTVPWIPIALQPVDKEVGVLTIGYFTEEASKIVEEKLKEAQQLNFRKLIIDIRDNTGGSFDQAVKVAGLFMPNEATIASTKSRDGKVEIFKASKTGLSNSIELVVLTNKATSSGAELFAQALKENRGAKVIGESTFGKWNAQMVETLPNHFAIKFTVMEFLPPSGKSLQDVGITPDIEVLLPKDLDIKEMRSRHEMNRRLELDPQLRAAVQIIKSL